MHAVILAGGLATRLGSLARTTPKALLPVGGRPLLTWKLEQLASSGYTHVVICAGHLADHLERYLASTPMPQVDTGAPLQVVLRQDGDKPLGTGGALAAVVSDLPDTFLVTYGDSYLPFDHGAPLVDLQACAEALGTMAVFRNDSRWDASNCRVEDHLVVEYRKPPPSGPGQASAFAHIDYGALALRIEALAGPWRAPFGLEHIQSSLATRRRLRAMEAPRRFYEIGSPEGLVETDRFLAGLGS